MSIGLAVLWDAGGEHEATIALPFLPGAVANTQQAAALLSGDSSNLVLQNARQ